MFTLSAFAVMLAFGFFFPKTFKVFYYLFMLPVCVLGPAGLISIPLWIFGVDVPFSVLCFICFFAVYIPFMKITAPE